MSKLALITNRADLAGCIQSARESGWVGVDTEFLRVKTYYPLLCLIQLRTGSGEYCVDALAIPDLSPLAGVFSDVSITKVFHSCRQDLEALDRRLDEPLVNLYDTQVAAAICGYGDQVGYAAMVEKVFGTVLPKTHTRTDWSARPLSRTQFGYAMDDVRYLGPLRDFLDRKLSGLGRREWMKEECRKIVGEQAYLVEPGQAWKRLKGGERLPVKSQATARSLAIWRERVAQSRNRPREWILSSRAILEIAMRQPGDLRSLAGLENLNAGVVKRWGDQILATVRDALVADGTLPVWTDRRPLHSHERHQVQAIMKVVREASKETGISQSLLASRGDIESIVRGRLDLPVLAGWRRVLVGERILACLARAADPRQGRAPVPDRNPPPS
ncbi:MAG: ribonuclease D [Gammaproteobacteria bacterium]|nr:ribonuclease D [Gammaproteobacteria bacterium]